MARLAGAFGFRPLETTVNKIIARVLLTLLSLQLLAAAPPVWAQAITYQGVLTAPGGVAINGPVDVQARLYNAQTGGQQIGPQVSVSTVASAGRVTLALDFGPQAFRAGEARWLELDVGYPGGGGVFFAIEPRQAVSPAPQAIGLVGVSLTPGGPEVFDQVQDSPGSNALGANGPGVLWQSFTAGRSGTLSGVEVQISKYPDVPVGTLTMQVYEGVGLSGPLLATSTVEIGELAQGEFTRVVRLNFSSVSVLVGSAYTLQFTGPVFVRTATVAIPGATGISGGNARNYWFRTSVTPIALINAQATSSTSALRAFSAFRADSATSAQTAVTAQTATTAQTAVTAETATTAQSSSTAQTADSAPWLGLTGQPEVRTGAVGTGWQLLLNNTAQTSFRGGLRLSDGGFLELTNLANQTAPIFARLSSLGVWTTVSDGRLKDDVAPDTGLLDAALKLRPVQFSWRHSGERDHGLIAQEVQQVLPHLVLGDGQSETLTVNYGQLSVVAIGAIQELRAQHAREIESLRTENQRLRERLDAIEAALRAGAVKR